jgi:hypothetical protein
MVPVYSEYLLIHSLDLYSAPFPFDYYATFWANEIIIIVKFANARQKIDAITPNGQNGIRVARHRS